MPTASYEIRIRGRVTEPLLSSFEGMSSTFEPVETVLHGRSATRPSCRLIDRIQALGLELVEVRRLPTGPGSARATGARAGVPA